MVKIKQMKLTPIYNKIGETSIRYIIKDVKIRQWDSVYALLPAYRFVCDVKDGAKTIGRRMIFRVALTEEWLNAEKNSGSGFKCIHCNDTGIQEGKFCRCELGSISRIHFKTYYD